jgi:hypothetical protein
MDVKTLNNIRSRADAKLRYAEIHLNELKTLRQHGGNDFDRAHLESFLFHLLGAKEAFLIELNAYYDCQLPENEITSGNLRKILKSRERESDELTELFRLENEENSWLYHAKEMRDHSTHISGIPHAFHLGGLVDHQVWLQNPKNGQYIEQDFVELLDNWHKCMNDLINNLRASAIKATNSRNE